MRPRVRIRTGVTSLKKGTAWQVKHIKGEAHIQSTYLRKSGKNMYSVFAKHWYVYLGRQPQLIFGLPAVSSWYPMPWSLSLFLCFGSYSMDLYLLISYIIGPMGHPHDTTMYNNIIRTSTTPEAHSQSTRLATTHTKQRPGSTYPKHPNRKRPG